MQFEIRKSQYRHHWKTDLPQAICADPCCEFSQILLRPDKAKAHGFNKKPSWSLNLNPLV